MPTILRPGLRRRFWRRDCHGHTIGQAVGWVDNHLRSWNPRAEERAHWLRATLRNHFRRPTKCYREGVLGLTFQLPPRSQQHNSGEF
jgi:hypothetical protein